MSPDLAHRTDLAFFDSKFAKVGDDFEVRPQWSYRAYVEYVTRDWKKTPSPDSTP